MDHQNRIHHIILLLLLVVVISLSSSNYSNGIPLIVVASSKPINLASCLTKNGITNFTTPSDAGSFITLLQFSIQNLRFTEPGVPRPSAIILPKTQKELRSSYSCIRASNLAFRIRSGGHSYEGISSTILGSTNTREFAIIDLMNLNTISIDVAHKTAWVEAGARLGELYYAISSSPKLGSGYGFSAGTCATIGVGGHIMGGGYGMLSRKYGVSADNILDAKIITPNGTFISSVASQDKDLFWAIRGGGGGSWGIVVSWKLKLLPVPLVLTTFYAWRTGKASVTDLAYKWQSVAPSLAPPELFIVLYMAGIRDSSGRADIGSSFNGQYWGTIDQTVALMKSLFPELGLTAAECTQGNWAQVNKP